MCIVLISAPVVVLVPQPMTVFLVKPFKMVVLVLVSVIPINTLTTKPALSVMRNVQQSFLVAVVVLQILAMLVLRSLTRRLFTASPSVRLHRIPVVRHVFLVLISVERDVQALDRVFVKTVGTFSTGLPV